MKLADYPPQEPLSALGTAYHERVIARGAGIEGSEFAYGDDPYQRLTVYPADSPAGDVLVFFHGGGWTSGYKEWMAFMAPPLQARGITFVIRRLPARARPSLSDRLRRRRRRASPGSIAHAGEHGGDPARIFVGGHSSGGHYAALLAATADWRRARGLPADVVRGCLPVSGVVSLRRRERPVDAAALSRPGRAKATPTTAASPLFRIDAAACPPFLLAWGSRDFPHLTSRRRQMHGRLQRRRHRRRDLRLRRRDHFEASLACGQTESGWPDRAAAWMRASTPTPNH